MFCGRHEFVTPAENEMKEKKTKKKNKKKKKRKKKNNNNNNNNNNHDHDHNHNRNNECGEVVNLRRSQREWRGKLVAARLNKNWCVSHAAMVQNGRLDDWRVPYLSAQIYPLKVAISEEYPLQLPSNVSISV